MLKKFDGGSFLDSYDNLTFDASVSGKLYDFPHDILTRLDQNCARVLVLIRRYLTILWLSVDFVD